MIDILKKQWFVVIIALILIIFGVYVTYDTNKGKLPGKKADGKSIVVSTDLGNITADALNDKMTTNVGDSYLAMYFQKSVVNQAVETTDDLKSEAKLQTDQILESMKQQAPTNYEQQIGEILKTMGYEADELETYTLVSVKNQKLQSDYFDSKLDELFTPIYDSKQSRNVSHILVKMEDSANPSEEEQAKVKSIEDALAAGKDFGEVAKEFSDDTTSAIDNGSIGYVDSDSGLVAPFLAKTLELGKDEVSDWVKVTSSDSNSYSGWHIIKVTETDKVALEEDENLKEGIYAAISKANPKIGYEIIWKAAKDLNIEFPDEAIKTKLMNYMGIKE